MDAPKFALLILLLSGIAQAGGLDGLRGRPDIPLGTPVADVASGTQWSPAVASNGEGYLAVWFDARSGRSQIYATRIDRTGRILDPMGIPVTQRLSSSSPAVGWDGSNYLVTWESESYVYATRVSREGEVLDPSGIPVLGARYQSVVASGGPSSLILTRGFQSLLAAVMSPEGNVIRSGILLDSAHDGFSLPAAVWHGQNYRLFWSVVREFRGSTRELGTMVVSAGGEILDRKVIHSGPRSTITAPIKVAWNGSRFLVVYRGPEAIYRGAEVQGVLVDGDGFRIGEPFRISERPAGVEKIDVASDGRGFLVTWFEEAARGESELDPATSVPPNLSYDVQGAWVDSDGSVSPLGALTSSARSNHDPSIASNGSDFLVAWVNKRFTGASEKFDVLGRLVGRHGPLSAEQPLAFSATAQRWPAMATNGKLHFVVWADETDAGREVVLAARFTRFGEPLDAAPFRVSESANDQSIPAIGFDGNHFLIVWMEYDRQSSPWRQPVLGRRFTSTGVPIDPASFEIAEQPSQFFPPSVSSNGTTFFVAADNQAAVIDFQDNKPVISLNRISAAGRYIRPSSAWTGSMYLAVWTRVDAGVPDWGLYGLRVSASGFALDSLPYAIAETNASESGSVACSSGGCLAAWNNGRGIRVGRMSANGDLLDRTAEAGGTSIVDWPGNRAAWHPAIFARRDGYVVVWSTADAQGIWQLYYAELDLSGRPVAPAALLTGSGENEYPAALVFDASGLSSMVYQRLARGDLYGGVNRVFLRTPASTPRQRPAR